MKSSEGTDTATTKGAQRVHEGRIDESEGSTKCTSHANTFVADRAGQAGSPGEADGYPRRTRVADDGSPSTGLIRIPLAVKKNLTARGKKYLVEGGEAKQYPDLFRFIKG